MLTRHCHSCGWEYAIAGLPGRTESCHQCVLKSALDTKTRKEVSKEKKQKE